MGTAYAHPDDMPEGSLASMNLTRDGYEQLVRERAERNYKAPKVGDPAPDFAVERLDSEGRRTEELFRLSDVRGRVVALAFGSYTAPPFRAHPPPQRDISGVRQPGRLLLRLCPRGAPASPGHLFSTALSTASYTRDQPQ